MSGDWKRYAAATDGGIERSVFYFGGAQDDLYGSFYEGDGRLAIGVVFCPAWSLEAMKSYVPRDLAAGVAALGGSALVYHYPATGDSFGRLDEVDLAALRRSAVAAVAEARRRAPSLRWVLAGYTFGTSVAVLAAAEAEVDALLLLEPALDPPAHAAEVAEQARRGQLGRQANDGFFYGQPLPRLAADDPSPAALLEAFDGDAVLVRSAEGAPATPLPAGVELRTVPGVYERRRERAPELVEAALGWIAELEPAPAPRAPEPRAARPVAGTDGAIVEHPLLVPTERGLLGAVVTEPTGPIRARLAFFHGAGDPRAGVNAHWARTLREVSALGVQVLRVDWAGTYESHTARGPTLGERKLTLGEVLDWFRTRTESHPLFLLGSCFGADAVAEVAPSRDDVAALGLVVPQLAAPRRSVGRLLGRPEIPELTPSVAAALSEIVDRVHVWILAGDVDGDYPAIVQRHFRRGTRPAVSVAPGVKLHSFHSAAAQGIVRAAIVAWVTESLGVEARERTMGLEPTTDTPQARFR